MEFQFDVFLSHNKADKVRVRELAQGLKQAGLRVWFDEWTIRPGDDIYLAVERGLEASRALVLCLSPAALKSDWVSLERSTVLFRDPANVGRRFIPLLLADCKLPDTLRRYHFIDYRIGIEDAFHELLLACKRSPRRPTIRKPQDEDESESDKFAASIQSHMESLHRSVNSLKQDQFRVIQQLRGQRRVRISGCSGSGKTLVAAEKALRLSQAGVSTLFLCHNPLLAEQIAVMTRGSGVLVEAFGSWVGRLAGERTTVGLKLWTNYEEPEPETLARALDALSHTSDRFEAVVVDEGQDFREEWWTLVEQALSDPQSGILYIFHDDHQALLPYRASYPIKAPVLDLSRNCRNAGRVFELMRCLNSQAPLPERELRGLGEVLVISYKRGEEREVVSQAVRYIAGTPVGLPFVVLLGGTVSYEESPFSGATISVSGSRGWQEEVRTNFQRGIRVYNKTGIVCPKGGWQEVEERLKRLSSEPYPTPQDVKLVHEVARSFRVDSAVRRRILDNPRFRNALRWLQKNESLKLSRPFRAPLWTAEIILHFEREDWHEQIPKPKTITFCEHTRVEPAEAIPVYYIGAFKGLEADVVLMFVQGVAPVPLHEVYVGISRARLLLVLLIGRETEAALPPGLRAFKCSFP